MIESTLRRKLKKEVDEGTGCHTIAKQLGCISQPGLRKFLIGESHGTGVLLDALAARYKLTLTLKGRKRSK